MTNITLVTGLFNIGRANLDGQFARPFEQYKGWFSQTLQIDLPMVVYCEPELEDFVWDNRGGKETVVITKSVESFRKTFYYKRVQKIRENPEWYNQTWWLPRSPQAALALYNPLIMYKMYFLYECAGATALRHGKPYFNAEKLLWIDAGITNTIPLHAFENFGEKIDKWTDKMLFLCFPYRSGEAHGFKTEGLDEYAGTYVDRVARATLWGGPVKLIKEIVPQYTRILSDTLNQGYMGTEENILTLLTYLVPDKCNTYMLENDRLTSFFEELSKG